MKCKWMVLTAACVLLSVAAGGCADTEKTETKKESPKTTETKSTGTSSNTGDALPLPVFFEGTDLDGQTVTSDIFSESKVTMINVWATYCSPCLNEMPELGELAGEYEQEEFQIIGVISDILEGDDQEKLDLAAQLVEKTGADYTHLVLNESLYNALVEDVTAVPTTFFLNDKGMVLDTVVGARDKDAWKEMIDEVLEKS